MKFVNKKVLTSIVFGAALATLSTIYSCKQGEEDSNPCGITCQNNGELIVVEDYCYCECPPGFEGEQCEIAPD